MNAPGQDLLFFLITLRRPGGRRRRRMAVCLVSHDNFDTRLVVLDYTMATVIVGITGIGVKRGRRSKDGLRIQKVFHAAFL